MEVKVAEGYTGNGSFNVCDCVWWFVGLSLRKVPKAERCDGKIKRLQGRRMGFGIS